MLCKCLLFLGAVVSFGFCSSARAFIPSTNTQGQFVVDEQGNFLLDPGFSFGNLTPFSESGIFAADSEIVRLAGYNPSRSWQTGDHPIDVIKFGDFQGFGLETLTLDKINGSAAADYSLAELELLDGMTLRELVSTVPGLKSKKAGSIAPLQAVLPSELWHISVVQLLDEDTSDLKQSLRFDKAKNIVKELKSKLFVNQEVIVTGIIEGIEVSVEGIVSQLQKSNPLLELNPELIEQNISNQIIEEVIQAEVQLQENIQYYSDFYFHLSNANIEGAIDKAVTAYQTEILQTVTNSKQQFIQSIESQVNAQLDLEQIAVIDGQLDRLNSAVNSYLFDSSTKLTGELTKVVTDEFTAVDEIVSQLPDELGDLSLESLNFDSFSVGDIPGLAQTPINRFSDYKNQAIGTVPGIENLPLSKFPNIPVYGGGIARIDWVFSDIERYADRAISGSKKEGFNAFCYENNSENGGCAHIELVGNVNNGKQWVSGDSQRVRGGKGFLSGFGGGQEPTGRLPFPGSRFKMVLRNYDEVTETVDLYLAFQFCVTIPFGGKHCTPHNIFEIPFTQYKAGDWIYLGVNL